MKRTLLVILSLSLLFYSSQSQAQTTKTGTFTSWYLGVKGGIPIGISNFNSFGTNKTLIGYNFGLLTGYRYNSILSAELSVSFGNISLGAASCCADYWLSAARKRYDYRGK